MEYQAKYWDTITLISNIHKMNNMKTHSWHVLWECLINRHLFFYFGSGRIFVHCLVDSCTYLFSLHTVVLEKNHLISFGAQVGLDFCSQFPASHPVQIATHPSPNKKEVWMSKVGRGVSCWFRASGPAAYIANTPGQSTKVPPSSPDSSMILHPRVTIFWMISSLEHHWTELH